MNYEERSNSIKLERTLTPNFVAAGFSQEGRRFLIRSRRREENHIQAGCRQNRPARCGRMLDSESPCYLVNFYSKDFVFHRWQS